MDDLNQDTPIAESQSNLGQCYRHAEVETGLRCNRCNNFICPKCAKRTPVGFRCPDCIYELEDKYYSGGYLDYAIAVGVALPLSAFAAGAFSFLLGSITFLGWILCFILAPVVSGGIAEAVRWAVSKRRSRYLGYTVAACIVSCSLALGIFLFLASNFNFFVLIPSGTLIVVGAPTAAARLR